MCQVQSLGVGIKKKNINWTMKEKVSLYYLKFTYRYQVLHHIHMWQRVNLSRLASVGVNLI